MQNNTLYTRCPTCSTAFKVTDKLLAMAEGKVRCGACLAIFQATDYMLAPSKKLKNHIQSPTKNDQPPASDKVTNQQTIQSVTMDVQQPLISEHPVDKVLDTPSDPDLDLSVEQSSNQIEPDKETQKEQTDELGLDSKLDFDPPEFNDSGLDNIEFQDSEINEKIINDDPKIDEEIVDEEIVAEKITPAEKPALDLTELSDEPAFINEQPLDDGLPEVLNMPEPLDELNTVEPPIEQIETLDTTDEPFDAAQQIEPPDDEHAAIDETTVSETDFDESAFDETDKVDESDFLDGTEFIDETQVYDALNSADELSDQLSEQMLDTDSEPDPLDEFNDIVEENNNSMKIKLAIASLLVLLIIAFTSIWSNRQAIAWSETWGDSMTSVCQYLPCDLKPRRDVSKIKLLQRQLSPDEELDNVLDVKVLLINEATFDQPYPTIKIAFSNKNGERVSVKYFEPADYLDKQSLNDLMPSYTEVHIHFKTEVTHPDALGFEFIFE